MSPRQTWLDQRTDIFLTEASAHGLTAPRNALAGLIDTAVNRVALRMRITPRTARKYFNDDDVRALVHTAAESMTAEAPGTQLADLDPTHTVPIALAGRTAAGLAILTELAATASAGADHRELVHELTQTLSLITEWGSAIAASATIDESSVAVHEAAIHRTIREFERGRKHLADGIEPLDGGNPDTLTHAFGDNITALRNEL